MFESTNKEILASLRDFIGDALSQPEISPTDILEAIQDELKELIDYHKIQGAKGQKLLDMLQTPEDVLDFSKRFQRKVAEDKVEDEIDKLTFGGYDFNLSSDYLYPPAASDVPYIFGGEGTDTISFNLDAGKKKNKHRKNRKNPKLGDDWKNEKW